jgi:CubicO group peptidase (beta-lactamase class C family)
MSRQLVAAVMQQAIADRVFPGGVVAYLKEGRPTILPFGHLTYDVAAPVVQADTYYDVASVTKSIPTACLALKLIEERRLSLDDRVSDFIPELSNQYRDQALVRHLLTYTYVLDLPKGPSAQVQEGLDVAGLWQLFYETPLKAAPGSQYLYSNVSAILLGLIVERVSGRPLAELAAEWFFGPLGMKRTTFEPETLPTAEVAPTEIDWRGEIHGQVHDETAWVLRRAGYTAGHAGLFSTAGDLLRFATMLLAGGEYEGRHYFQPDTIKLMHTNQLDGLGLLAGLGWDLGQRRHMGRAATAEAFGKTGFTGSYILIDPAKQITMVVLANRIYPHRPASPDDINAVRSGLADIIFA